MTEAVDQVREDEKRLLYELQQHSQINSFVYVRDVVKELGMNEKRAAYILSKWEKRGWYNWGVNILAGWLTEEGKTVRGGRKC